MIIIDVQNYEKELTLEHCAKEYDALFAFNKSSALSTLPLELHVTPWQHKNIFSDTGGEWKYWRGVPIVTVYSNQNNKEQ